MHQWSKQFLMVRLFTKREKMLKEPVEGKPKKVPKASVGCLFIQTQISAASCLAN
jgi:hypothetical protein